MLEKIDRVKTKKENIQPVKKIGLEVSLDVLSSDYFSPLELLKYRKGYSNYNISITSNRREKRL